MSKNKKRKTRKEKVLNNNKPVVQKNIRTSGKAVAPKSSNKPNVVQVTESEGQRDKYVKADLSKSAVLTTIVLLLFLAIYVVLYKTSAWANIYKLFTN